MTLEPSGFPRATSASRSTGEDGCRGRTSRRAGDRPRAAAAGHRRRAAIAVACLLALAGSGCARGVRSPDAAATQPVGPYRIGLTGTPDPPAVGENHMILTVRDDHGRPVRGAAVEVVVSMPAMGAMPYMESRAEVRETSPGRYRASYGLSMHGDWDVTLRVRPPGGTPVEAAYRVSMNAKGIAFVSGTPPTGAAAEAGAAPDHAAHTGGGAPAAGGASAGTDGVVNLDAARRQSLGIQVAPVGERPLTLRIRAAGRVAYDETRAAEVSLKYSGWVREVVADFIGANVRRGQTLFFAYSPELWSAQQEFLEALRAARADSTRVDLRELADAARRRLQLWDLTGAEVDAIARSGRPREALAVAAQASGVVVEKSVVQGSPFQAGQVLYRIARTDPVWVLASVFPEDLPHVRAGMPARVLDPYAGTGGRAGRVSFVAPEVAAETRTGTARIEVANSRGELKPGMYVDVEMVVPLGTRLAVPQSAVLPTGTRRIVFVDLGDGRLAPREVTLGAHAGEWYEVLSGLASGDQVVTSGNFLIASESRLRSAAAKW